MRNITVTLIAMFLTAFSTFAQDARSMQLRSGKELVTAEQGQIVKIRRAFDLNRPLVVSNPNERPSDVDVSIFDDSDVEIERNTIEAAANSVERVDLKALFPDLNSDTAYYVVYQISVRSNDSDPGEWAVQLPIAFFSQRDSRWSANKLGTCRNDTIRSSGCAITAIASALSSIVSNMNPASLNTYLTNNSGYSGGCNVIWSKAAEIDGRYGATYVGSGTVSSVSNLKSLIDRRNFAVVRSTRFSSHWALIIGYRNSGTKLSDFYYVDPYDTSATFRNVGDGWVSTASATRIYK